jgi:hypothetical protein
VHDDGGVHNVEVTDPLMSRRHASIVAVAPWEYVPATSARRA